MHFREWLIAKGVSFASAAFELTITSIVCVAVIFAWEIWQLGHERSSVQAIRSGDASARRDLLSFVLDVTGILRVLGHVVTLGIGFAIGNAVRVMLGLNLTGLIANPALQVATFLFFKSFCDYWMHRWMHLSPVLWEIHKYHHSADEMNVVTAHREGILVTPFVSIFAALPFGILGLPVHTFILVAVVLEFHALIIHSRLTFELGWFEWLIISPRAHRLHHALELSRGTQNYGFTTSIWDHVFGTYGRAPDVEFPVGLERDFYNTAPWHLEMAHSMAETGRAIVRLARRAPIADEAPTLR